MDSNIENLILAEEKSTVNSLSEPSVACEGETNDGNGGGSCCDAIEIGVGASNWYTPIHYEGESRWFRFVASSGTRYYTICSQGSLR